MQKQKEQTIQYQDIIDRTYLNELKTQADQKHIELMSSQSK